MEEIEVLENMLNRMVEGHLGCSGFNITETDALRFALKELKKKKNGKIPRDEMLKVANAMLNYGGSFVSSLGKALLDADEVNQQKIKNAFPECWEKYKKGG